MAERSRLSGEGVNGITIVACVFSACVLVIVSFDHDLSIAVRKMPSSNVFLMVMWSATPDVLLGVALTRMYWRSKRRPSLVISVAETSTGPRDLTG